MNDTSPIIPKSVKSSPDDPYVIYLDNASRADIPFFSDENSNAYVELCDNHDAMSETIECQFDMSYRLSRWHFIASQCCSSKTACTTIITAVVVYIIVMLVMRQN